ARDAMPEGGVLTIKTDSVYLDEHYISVHGGAAPGSYCMLSVSDTGCGIDEKTRRQIFDPFFTTKKKGKGTGLGLATVYGVVKQHGGNIWLYSEVGQGSVFKIYLPQVNLVVTERELEKQKRVLAKGGEVVLVVEDEAPLRKIIGRMLQHLGYVPLETAYGAEAVECAKQEGRIDLLLTDVIMPGMNGRQVYEAVSAIRPGIKTVFMSGYTDNVIAQHGVLEGSIPFIPKPFSEAVLSQKIQEALQG
ncbi:TPA: hybrid sensor histidine kinase/response regulator, partial [Candidatus Sumerlaeota bacterium]|nr:hybrid sensor histidine kinase/response regulator [Candidatus Sumerlaeota bacterium]